MITRSSLRRRKVGPTAAREAPGGAFEHPVAFDQVLDDQRDGAALKAGEAGEIGARDRLLGADQIENRLAVDIADPFARRDLHFFCIDGAHFV